MSEIREAKLSKVNEVYQKGGNIVCRNIGGELILVPISREAGDMACFYTLNSVGARIWELLDGKRPVADIAGTIVEEYEVDLEGARKDSMDFLRRMEEMGVVTLLDGQG
ncbi:MAG: PqqD family protein [Chloroflexota bacterium]